MTGSGPLPAELAGFRELHAGETIVVCGCGASLAGFEPPPGCITIGVNDVGRRFDPTYLVVLNPRPQFSGDRFRHVEESRARTVFSQLRLGLAHAPLIRLRLGRRGGTDLSDHDSLPYTRNSPYVALCLALFMGARRIGLIGVDFTDDHFFAATGRHSLAGDLPQIDREYRRLAETCERLGVEVVNLSPASRLTAFPRRTAEDFFGGGATAPLEPRLAAKRVFFVHHRFLYCGDVFRQGLEHAAGELGLEWTGAFWDDPGLPQRAGDFAPDLLFVIHGRNFATRLRRRDWVRGAGGSAVWLLGEPYEVDDTARWSGEFDTVFVNDTQVLSRHSNAHYLPTAYAPHLHHDGGGGVERPYDVGFVGAATPTRRRLLQRLADENLLSYVVGEPWRSPGLERLCLAGKVPAERTAELYRQTRIVLNVFLDRHHYNRRQVAPWSLNPRVYEALACGALAVSERRPEAAEAFPALPVFASDDEMVATVARLLADEAERRRLTAECRRLLGRHTYAERLKRVLRISFPAAGVQRVGQAAVTVAAAPTPVPLPAPYQRWLDHGGVATIAGDEVVLDSAAPLAPGSERGLASVERFEHVELAFEVLIEPRARFLAKLHQQDRLDQATNSYHLSCQPERSYVAMHDRVFRDVAVERGAWQEIAFQRAGDLVVLKVGGETAARVVTGHLRAGFCFLGTKGGRVRLRNVRLAGLDEETRRRLEESAAEARGTPVPAHRVLQALGLRRAPRVSVITTVYDRVSCLRSCLRSMRQSSLPEFEHLVIADHPPPEVREALLALVREEGDGRTLFADLDRRHDNWGIAPARVGLHLARGEYVCFLSDDNAFTEDHLANLAAALDGDPGLGFAYSSCDYAGRLVLRSPRPRPSRIDLGQPLFRRRLFADHLGGTIPFEAMAWDWEMIAAFLSNRVRWRHVDRITFLFRFEECLRRRAGWAGRGERSGLR